MSVPVVAPADIRDYAKSLGWSLLPEAVKDRLFVLTHPELRPRQIVIPMDPSAPDYVEAVQIAIQKLADLHGLSLSHVLIGVQTAREDTQWYRITSPSWSMDSLPLSFAASLVQAAQQILLASACTVLKPQTHHPRLHRSEAQQLVDSARFNQTERGSFVFSVSCPINALDVQAPLPLHGAAVPFVRQTTWTINRALQKLVDAVETDTMDTLIEETRSSNAPILSSNLCEAVSRLHDESIGNDVELSFAWAASAPLPRGAPVRKTIRIQSDYFDRIDDVQRALRATEGHRDGTFVGTVEGLEGEMGPDNRRAGEVIVALLLREGESVRAKLILGPDGYDTAARAHLAQNAYVRITGRLHPGRQPRLLSHISNFETIMPP
jgi:hypothetical protein